MEQKPPTTERSKEMADEYHYPPDVFSHLVDTIPLLCRSKKDTVAFFRGAGVADADLAGIADAVSINPASINKYEISRAVLTRVNERGDSGLAARREIIRRVVQWEDFSTSWDGDRLKAKGAVATLRDMVNVKDSFTRMKQERDAERAQAQKQVRQKQEAATRRRNSIADVKDRLSALFGLEDKPQARGKQLEAVLNDLFRVYCIHVHEDFRRKDPDTGLVLEQLDGVIELDGSIHLVEMKWLASPVGMSEFVPHLSRLFLRANAHGFFISSSGFTDPVVTECRNALSQKTMALCSLQEIVLLLNREADLRAFLKRKHQAAIVSKEPYLQILS